MACFSLLPFVHIPHSVPNREGREFHSCCVVLVPFPILGVGIFAVRKQDEGFSKLIDYCSGKSPAAR